MWCEIYLSQIILSPCLKGSNILLWFYAKYFDTKKPFSVHYLLILLLSFKPIKKSLKRGKVIKKLIDSCYKLLWEVSLIFRIDISFCFMIRFEWCNCSIVCFLRLSVLHHSSILLSFWISMKLVFTSLVLPHLAFTLYN